MTHKVYMDFESRSQANIWDTGAWVYAEHPSTEILCLCYAVDDGPVYTLTREHLRQPKYLTHLNNLIKTGAEFHAHNAYFERVIWLHKMLTQYSVLPIPLKQWWCTAAKCSAHALPRSLEHAAIALGCKNLKDKTGTQIMRFIARSTGVVEQSKLNRLYEYCVKDVEAEREIDQKLPDLPDREQRIWLLDQVINDRGVCVDLDAVNKASVIIKEEVNELTTELQKLSGGEIDKGTQTAVIKRYLEKQGCKLPNLQKENVVDALKNSDPKNTRILQLRQQLSRTSNAKYQAMLTTAAKDGRIRDILIYHGASTGRWTGKLVQLQNLPRLTDLSIDPNTAIEVFKNGGRASLGMLYNDLLSVMSGCIRGMFVPTPGYEMFTSDYAAIEARVVMWLAGEETGLKMFRAQDLDPTMPDIYVHMARDIYGNLELTKKNKQERQLGKQTVLACGFGMGINKFIQTCQTYHIEVDDRLAERAVYTYRKMFKKVVNFWYAMERCAIKCVLTKQPQRVGKITWYMEGEFLKLWLPAGRALAYHHPRVDADNKLSFMAVNGTTNRYVPEDTWGGKLVENATQAVARDIMADSMLHMASAGFQILFTVHDELVVEALMGSRTEEDILKIQRVVPKWATGCPINAECEKIRRYKKS